MGMTDRDKIINAIEKAKKQSNEYALDRIIVPFKEADMILAILKEREPKQIVRKQVIRENSDGSTDYFTEWSCPHCGKILDRGFGAPWIDFCYKCGKAVKWE